MSARQGSEQFLHWMRSIAKGVHLVVNFKTNGLFQEFIEPTQSYSILACARSSAAAVKTCYIMLSKLQDRRTSFKQAVRRP